MILLTVAIIGEKKAKLIPIAIIMSLTLHPVNMKMKARNTKMLEFDVVCPKCGKRHEVYEENYASSIEFPYLYTFYEGRCEHCGVLLQWAQKNEYVGIVSITAVEGR